MKACFTAPALALNPAEFPTDPGYEYRTIALDAERAWKMREPLERALSWPKGSKQEMWWLGAYYAAGDAS